MESTIAAVLFLIEGFSEECCFCDTILDVKRMMNLKIKFIKKLLLHLAVLLLFGAMIAGVSASGILTSASPEGIRDQVLSWGPWASLAYLILFILVPLTLFPDAVLAIASGMAFGMGEGLFLTWLGALLGGSLAFWLARLIGQEALEKLQARLGHKARQAPELRGFLSILVLRLVPLVPFDVISYGAGLSHVRYRDFLGATALGILPGVVVYVNVGDKLFNWNSSQFYLAIALLIGLTVVSSLGVRTLRTGRPVSFSKRLSTLEKEWFPWRRGRLVPGQPAFFPGCSLVNVLPETARKTISIFERLQCGWLYDCCGKPLQLSGNQPGARRVMDRINGQLKRANVTELVVACPNCYSVFRKGLEVPVKDIYTFLQEHNIPCVPFPEALPIFSPCPDRRSGQIRKAIEDWTGSVLEEARNLPCCGLGIPDAKQARKALDTILLDQRKLSPYCASCHGHLTRHGMKMDSHILTRGLGIREDSSKGIRKGINRMKPWFWRTGNY